MCLFLFVNHQLNSKIPPFLINVSVICLFPWGISASVWFLTQLLCFWGTILDACWAGNRALHELFCLMCGYSLFVSFITRFVSPLCSSLMEGFWFLCYSDIASPLHTSHNTILVQVLKADSHPDRCMCVRKKALCVCMWCLLLELAVCRSGFGWLGRGMWEVNKLMNDFSVSCWLLISQYSLMSQKSSYIWEINTFSKMSFKMLHT